MKRLLIITIAGLGSVLQACSDEPILKELESTQTGQTIEESAIQAEPLEEEELNLVLANVTSQAERTQSERDDPETHFLICGTPLVSGLNPKGVQTNMRAVEADRLPSDDFKPNVPNQKCLPISE